MTRTPYSYRHDLSVPRFNDGAPLIIFDGMCVMCSRGVAWMMQHDPRGCSRFAAIQQPIPRALYNHYGLDAGRFDTFMVLSDGVPYIKWQGLLAAARTLPQPWRALGHIGRIIPSVAGDAVYDWLQRNRLHWFGARETCLTPDAVTRARFL